MAKRLLRDLYRNAAPIFDGSRWTWSPAMWKRSKLRLPVSTTVNGKRFTPGLSSEPDAM